MSSAPWPPRGRAAGMTVLISTGDKDMSQLVNGAITIVNTMTDTRWTATA